MRGLHAAVTALAGLVAGVLLALPAGALASFGEDATATSTFATATLPPAAITGATYSCGVIGIANSITLSWTRSPAPGAAQAVQRRVGDASWTAPVAVPSSASTYLDLSVSAARTYTYRVVTTVGSWSATSAERSFRTPALCLLGPL